MPQNAAYYVQPFDRRAGQLRAGEPIGCHDEDHAGRRGRAMQHRVAGMVFFKIETSAEGDEWTEVEVLSTVGEVPGDWTG